MFFFSNSIKSLSFQVRAFAQSITIFLIGVKFFNPLIDLFEHDAEYRDKSWVRKSIGWSQNCECPFLIYSKYLKILCIIIYV